MYIFLKTADLPATFHWSNTIIESLVKCKHIGFTSWSDGLKFSVSVMANVELKTFPKMAMGNFELKSYPKG